MTIATGFSIGMHWATLLTAFLAFAPSIRATVIAIIVSKHAIVLATDSKTLGVSHGHVAPNVPLAFKKLRATSGGIIWAAAGTEVIRFRGRAGYDFQAFSDHIEKLIMPGSSVTDAAELIRRGLAITFDGFDVLIKHGVIGPKDVTTGAFIKFFVAGYERGVAKVFVIALAIDWIAKRLVGPSIVSTYPAGDCTGRYVAWCGAGPPILGDLMNPVSDYYKWAACRAPDEIRALNLDQDITPAQSVLLARVVIETGMKAVPRHVSLPIDAVLIRPNGEHMEYTYSDHIPNGCFAEKRTEKQKKH